VWLNGVELALEEFKRLDHLPHRILLCGGGASLEMLTDELANGDWYKDLPFARKPQVQLIRPDQVVGMNDTTGVIDDHTFITTMGTLLQYDSPTGSVRDRLNRLLKV
jgi:cell division protein FtsA